MLSTSQWTSKSPEVSGCHLRFWRAQHYARHRFDFLGDLCGRLCGHLRIFRLQGRKWNVLIGYHINVYHVCVIWFTLSTFVKVTHPYAWIFLNIFEEDFAAKLLWSAELGLLSSRGWVVKVGRYRVGVSGDWIIVSERYASSSFDSGAMAFAMDFPSWIFLHPFTHYNTLHLYL